MVAKAKQLHGSKSARTKSDKRYSKANYEFDENITFEHKKTQISKNIGSQTCT